MSNRSVKAGLALADVMAHCGGSPVSAVEFLGGAIADSPAAPEPYAALDALWADRRAELEAGLAQGGSWGTVPAQAYFSFLDGRMDDAVMILGSLTGARPDVAWSAAPWFGDPRFLGQVGAEALAEACLRVLDPGHSLDDEATRERFEPWFHALDVVSARVPVPESLAAMSRLPRACGRYDLALALCDRADAVEPVMWTAVARGTLWRVRGDLEQAAQSYEAALRLEPGNWSLYLDLADLRADQGDFAAAVTLVERGLEQEPGEITLRAAGAAYRARLSGSAGDLEALIGLVPELPNPHYGRQLLDCACAGPGLPKGLVREARRVREG
ncbi:tetratricopeptide repeat protein [Streptomyces sp. NPDC093250]|uniref:tetratricopeptide repeat protein n=1 Tax=Streptomyces sp. NPDC093250 TaxID=3366036 RepID=UPI0038042783